ncbi:hypothetical protein [Agromyces sp. NPDC060279]|uniref:DUF7507 domain-containing protein n=1 Tax=Agromyces sp. NPDC060279 TaxID=3347092 RepID=UPI00365CC955
MTRAQHPNTNGLGTRARARRPRWLASTVAIAALLVGGGGALTAANSASGAPGSPGIPRAASVPVFAEDFQNQLATNGIRLPQYTGGPAANASTYVASPAWLPAGDQCNGWILRSSTPRNAVVTGVDSGCDATAWARLQGMATAIGLFRGETLPVAQQNQILSAYTNGGSNPGPGVQFQTAKPITTSITAGHFYQISAIYGAVNCVSEGPGLGRQDPSLTFNLIQNQTGSGPTPGTGTGTVTTLASGLNPCTDPAARIITTAGQNYHIAKLNSQGFRAPAGVSTIGIQLYNAAGGFRGNDSGFDDPQIVDATPQLDKVFSPTTAVAGGTTTLTFTITNTDELAAKNGWSFTDTLPAGLAFAGTPSTNCPAGVATIDGNAITGSGNLDAGTASCTFTVLVTSAVAGTYTNGPGNIGPLDGLLEPGDSTVVFTVPETPAISLVKSADLADPSEFVVDRTVTYTFQVTNSGNVPLTAVAVAETAFDGSGTPSAISCPQTTLAVGAGMSCTATYVLTQEDIDQGSVTNTAQASGTPPSGPPVTADSTAVVSGDETPSIAIVKAADASGVQQPTEVGDPIAYTVTVTNTGNVTLVDVEVVDTLLGDGLSYTWPGDEGVLAPGQFVTVTGSHAVTQADIEAGLVTNTATTTGQTQGGTPVEAGPATTTTPLTQAPSLLLGKEATPDFASPPGVGDLIAYDFTIENTGNLRLENVSITDRLSGITAITYTWPGDPGVLEPGDIATGTASYAITQADIDAGGVINRAVANGTTMSGANTPSNEVETETPIDRSDAIALTKTADASGLGSPAEPGDPIVYHFVVTNTGNTPLTGVSIAEQLPGVSALRYTWPGADGVLRPGQFAVASASYPVTQADLDAGEVTNRATATGTGPDEDEVESPPATTTTPLDEAARITLVKSASPSDAASFTVGQVITYSFVVTNTGNVTVTGLAITEDAFSGSGPENPITCPSTPLPPGRQATCTTTYTLTQADVDAGQLANTARATGAAGDEPVESNPSSTVIPALQSPALSLVKSADVERVTAVGQVVSYTFRVTNIGNVTLRTIEVAETDFSGAGTAPVVTCPSAAAELLPGAFVDCEASYTAVAADLTGAAIENTAVATGTAPDESPVESPPSSASVETVTPTPTPTPVPPKPGPPLAGTGWEPPVGAIVIALLLTAAGVAALLLARRQPTGRHR